MPSRMAERDSSDMECDEEATFGESRSVVAGFEAVMTPGAADVSLETMTVDDAAFLHSVGSGEPNEERRVPQHGRGATDCTECGSTRPATRRSGELLAQTASLPLLPMTTMRGWGEPLAGW